VPNSTYEFVEGYGRGVTPAWRSLNLRGENAEAYGVEEHLDCMPAMSSTALGLEILLGESCVDLRAASDLVLNDVGATIQILRLAGRDYAAAADRPRRIVECLSGLNAEEWFWAIARRTFVCDREHMALAAFWRHSSMVARYARLAAESIDRVSPEDAYLVGLLHGVEAMPSLLIHGDGAGMQERAALAAIEGVLPSFVVEALQNAENPGSPWRFILNAAHSLAGTRIPAEREDFKR
jgi:hypothetical protein